MKGKSFDHKRLMREALDHASMSDVDLHESDDRAICHDCDAIATWHAHTPNKNVKQYCDHHANVRFGVDDQWRQMLVDKGILVPIASRENETSEKLDEEAVTDDLGEIVASDWVGDAAVAFGDAVQDVLQDHAKELVVGFLARSDDDGPMLARHEDVDGMAQDVVSATLGNEDLRQTMVQLARSGLRKMVS